MLNESLSSVKHLAQVKRNNIVVQQRWPKMIERLAGPSGTPALPARNQETIL
jgi:hypothetical protein